MANTGNMYKLKIRERKKAEERICKHTVICMIIEIKLNYSLSYLARGYTQTLFSTPFKIKTIYTQDVPPERNTSLKKKKKRYFKNKQLLVTC